MNSEIEQLKLKVEQLRSGLFHLRPRFDDPRRNKRDWWLKRFDLAKLCIRIVEGETCLNIAASAGRSTEGLYMSFTQLTGMSITEARQGSEPVIIGLLRRQIQYLTEAHKYGEYDLVPESTTNTSHPDIQEYWRMRNRGHFKNDMRAELFWLDKIQDSDTPRTRKESNWLYRRKKTLEKRLSNLIPISTPQTRKIRALLDKHE